LGRIVINHIVGGSILFTSFIKRALGFGFKKILFGKTYGSVLVLDDMGAHALDFYSAVQLDRKSTRL